jgi:adenylylsulfate kinase-like enzyme
LISHSSKETLSYINNVEITMNHMNAITIWFTGLSASGKTTLSTQLFKDLKGLGVDNVILLDGETMRDQKKNHIFDAKSREEIGFQKIKIASDLNKKGNIVLISGISHKSQRRKDARRLIDNYYEVYLKCDVSVCAQRDYKNQYSKAFLGELDNFVGVTEQYEEHGEADLVIYTGRDTLNECSSILLESIKKVIGLHYNVRNIDR